jgi:hypothetical protein
VLSGRAGLPLDEQRINARGRGIQDGAGARALGTPTGFGPLKVLIYGRTTQAQVPGHVLDTEAFDQDFVTDDMNSLHAQHSFPPVAEVLAQPYRTWGPECSFSACQTVQYPISATRWCRGRNESR